MRSWIARRTLRAFAKRYGYDVSYLLMMLNESPSAFFKFAPLMKAAAHREAVPINASFAAKIVGALAEDCGPCTQLVVDMALEAGMAKDQIEAVLRRDPRAMSDTTTLWRSGLRTPWCAGPPMMRNFATPSAPNGARKALSI